jgi:DNA-binding SARP family transcriptional activator
VAGRLWLAGTEARAQASLRSALWRLRQASAQPVVECTRTHLRLAPHVVVDVRRQIELARGLLGSAGATGEVDDLALLEGELLPDWYDEWVLLERERLDQLRLHALETVAQRLVAAGRKAEGIEAAVLAVRADPFRETAQRALIEALAAEGNRCDALRQYERYRNLVRSKLDLEPSRDLQGLVEELRR